MSRCAQGIVQNGTSRLTRYDQKLVALLHLELPPELHLLSAKASLLRVTFVLDFGVPQISIEVHGIQVQASLIDELEHTTSEQDNKRPEPRAPSSVSGAAVDDTFSDTEDHMPTVDALAESFIREEPAEIRELAQELQSQSSHMHESIASTDDGGEETSAGVGAPLGLPAYLRNILNTALDRLSIVINNVDVVVEDRTSTEPSSPTKPSESSPVSLNFHIERIGVDSLSAEGPRIDLSSTANSQGTASRAGKRRLQVKNICARLVSDVENLVSTSQTLPPLSPEITRSKVSNEETSYLEQSTGAVFPSVESRTPDVDGASSIISAESTLQAQATSVESLESEVVGPRIELLQEEAPLSPFFHKEASLAASAATVDDDRFADASS